MSKSKEAEAPAKILEYMKAQNRPYSVIDVFNNLHKEFGKTCVTRVMEQLAADGQLLEKVYGKQKTYVVNQDLLPAVSDEEMKAMEAEIVRVQQQLSESEQSWSALNSELSALRSSLTTEEARQQLAQIAKECKTFEDRLARIKSAAQDIDPKEVQRTEQKYNSAVKEWKKRKRLCTDMSNAILEGYPKSKKDLFEEVGIETDEDVGAQVPNS